MDDEAANLARLRRAGLAIPGVLHLERPVDDADPDGPRARFARLPLPDAPEGRVQLVRHLTPEAIWQERFMSHRTGPWRWRRRCSPSPTRRRRRRGSRAWPGGR